MFKFTFLPFLGLILILTSNKYLSAQAPQKFNYQGIARDAQGNPMLKQALSLKIAVLSTQDATVSDYEETQSATTNEFGLYIIQIGNGLPTPSFTSDGMNKVKWETGNKYIRVAIDPKGGNDYTVLGTTQLLSVPYALYADKAGQARESVTSSGNNRAGNVSTSAAGTGATNYLAKFTAPNTIYNSLLFDNGSAIGLGTNSPASRFHISTSNATQEHLRMENLNPAGWGKFIMYNDNPANYHTFTKYGSTYAGNYGPNTLFPYANLLAFGSNNSPTVMANGHNIGFATVSGANVTYKFIGVQNTGRVGIAGNSIPVADVHINRTDRTGDTVKITNNTTGHTTTDGLDIRTTGNEASIVNRENSILTMGTNNIERARITANGDIGIGTPTPGAKLEVAGQVKITGGSPAAGRVLTSDVNGLATWQIPAGGSGGVSSVNGATGAVSNSVTMGTTGTNTNVTGSGTNAVTINIPTASATNTGKLSNTDWITFNNKMSNSGGTINYIPKFTAGNLLGNSKLHEVGNQLLYNTLISQGSDYGAFFRISDPNSAASLFGIEGASNIGYTFLLVGDSSTTNKAIGVGQSNSVFPGTQDSAAYIIYNPLTGLASFTNGSDEGFIFNTEDGKMGNGYWGTTAFDLGDAHLNINSGYNTAGYFSANAANGSVNTGIFSDGNSDYSSIGVDAEASYFGNGNSSYNYGVRSFVSSSTQDSEGLNTSVYNTTDGYGIGVSAYALNDGPGRVAGAVLSATSSITNVNNLVYGADVNALAAVPGLSRAIGVNGTAEGGDADVIGVRGAALGHYDNVNGTCNAYGVFGSANGGLTFADAAYSIFGGAASNALTANNFAGYFNGKVHITGTLSKAGGSFKIDHPQDPENKYLIHSFVESPDMMNVYNGNIITDANGKATVELPSYFEAENKDFKYQLTVIDNSADFVMAKVINEVANNSFELKTSKPNVKVSWQVTGVRKDAWANANRIVAEVDKHEREKGKYLNPEVFGKDPSFAIHQEPKPVDCEINEKDKAAREEKIKKLKEMPYKAKAKSEELKLKKIQTTNEPKGAFRGN